MKKILAYSVIVILFIIVWGYATISVTKPAIKLYSKYGIEALILYFLAVIGAITIIYLFYKLVVYCYKIITE